MTEQQGNVIFILHCWRVAACFGRSLGGVRTGFVVGMAAEQAIFLKQKISWIASVLSCERNSQTWPAEDRDSPRPQMGNGAGCVKCWACLELVATGARAARPHSDKLDELLLWQTASSRVASAALTPSSLTHMTAP